MEVYIRPGSISNEMKVTLTSVFCEQGIVLDFLAYVISHNTSFYIDEEVQRVLSNLIQDKGKKLRFKHSANVKIHAVFTPLCTKFQMHRQNQSFPSPCGVEDSSMSSVQHQAYKILCEPKGFTDKLIWEQRQSKSPLLMICHA